MLGNLVGKFPPQSELYHIIPLRSGHHSMLGDGG